MDEFPEIPTDPPRPPRPRALVVENDLASRELLTRVLRQKGLEAETAIGAGQAERILSEATGRPYDLLLVDLNLEPADGVDVLRHVASLPAARRPGRIVAIGDSLTPFYARLSEVKLEVELFQKPVHIPSLMKVVEGLGKL
jgi:CheY-like chemotaxis protein